MITASSLTTYLKFMVMFDRMKLKEVYLQGDIVTVYDDEGSAMVTYNYDAWAE